MQFSKWVTLGFGALCLMAVAGVLNAQHLYYMSAILLTLPGVSYALGWYALRGLKFTRELPSSAWEGEEGAIVYAAENPTPIARYFLTVREPLPVWIAPLEEEPPLFNAPAQETTRVAHRVSFLKRGVYDVEHFDVTAMDPLGVFAFTKRIHGEGELVVYPLPQPLQPLALSGAERYGWQEFTRMVLRGSSVDPDGVREYAPGDPLRRIHWRQTARTGKLSVIEFEEAQAINLVIALDLKRGTEVGQGRDTTLEYGVRLTASLAQLAVQQSASLRLLLPSDLERDGKRAPSLAAVGQAGRGTAQLYAILDALARVQAESARPASATVIETGGSLLPGTTLLVITSHPDMDLPLALARYAVTGANVAVVYIDPETFAGGRGRVSDAQRQRFFAELLSARVRPFVLRYNDQGDLTPEAVVHAEPRSSDHAYA
ncbi:MAG TPA: DUF58 domain-containing protein [Chthonomonadaceae bacterium]|nr:DUF58 domain-containing protein [Chthonomonadaceae bacterium]